MFVQLVLCYCKKPYTWSVICHVILCKRIGVPLAWLGRDDSTKYSDGRKEAVQQVKERLAKALTFGNKSTKSVNSNCNDWMFVTRVNKPQKQ